MANEVTIDARLRTDDEVGSGGSRRLRRDGEVPATLYGHGHEPRNIAVPARELRRALTTEAGLNVLINLALDGEKPLVMAREVDRDPLRPQILHLDFIAVDRNEVVAAEVPVELVGTPIGVAEGGGVLQQQASTIRVEAAFSAVPSSIEADVTHLGIGSALTAADLVMPEGSTLVSDPATVVAGVTETKASKQARGLGDEEGEGGEGGEAEAAAAPADES
jgi:large subunit ribosomal protein L25